MSAGSRIVIEVAGDEAPLQASIDKAADALKSLADVVARTAKTAISSGADIIDSNKAVADSYGMIADASKASSSTIAASVTYQTDAVARSAAAQVTSNEDIERSLGAVADSAKASSDAVVAAAERIQAASRETATVSTASAAKSDAAFGASGSALTKFGKTALLGVTAVAAGSVYAAAKFQTATTQYITQAGVGSKAAGQLAKGILDMAGVVGQTPDELAGGMYHIVSSLNNLIPPAHRVQTELGILKIAAEGAAIGGSNMTQTTYVLSAALNALGDKTVPQAKQTMAELNAIVGAGDMHMQDLVNAMSTGILPVAKTFGISFQSIGAALDVLADKGVPAQQAATKLRMAITEMGAPTKMAAGILETLGLSSTQAIAASQQMTALLEKAGVSTTQIAVDLRQPDGILVALEDLKKHLEEAGLSSTGAAAVMSRAFGGIRGATSVEMLFQSLDKLQKKYVQIGQTAGQFTPDFTKTTGTLTFELHQIEGEIAAVGVRIGDALIPPVEHGIADLREFATWLDHNRVAAGALAGAITALGSVAIASYLTSRIRGAVTGLQQLTRALGFGGASSATGGVASGAGSASLTSMRGMTPESPMYVAIVAGEYAGLGSMGAAGTVEAEGSADMVAARAAAAGSGATATIETEAGIAGLGSTIVGGLKTALGSVMRGGLIAAIGSLSSKVAGGVIGGTAGSDVSKIGTDAAIGAGIGTVIPGVGTLAGAAGGALVGALTTFFHSSSFGDNVVHSLDTAIGKTKITFSAASQVKIAASLNTAHNAIAAVNPTNAIVPAGDDRAIAGEMKKAQAIATAASMKAGTEMAHGLEQAFNAAPKHLDLSFIERDTKDAMDKLPPAARAGVDGMMADFVDEMEKQGRLPEGSVASFMRTISGDFSGMKATFGSSTADAVAAVNANLDFTQATTSVNSFIQTLSQSWEGLPQTAKVTSSNAAQVFTQNLQFLHDTARTSSGQTKTDALANYQQLQEQAGRYFSTLTQTVNQQGLAQATSLGTNTQAGKAKVAAAFDKIGAIISTEMADGTLSVSAGMKKINQILNQELSHIGGSFGTAGKTATGTGASPLNPGSSITGNPVSPIVKAASGALFQIGAAGDRGRDTIPLSIGGMNLMVGSGEQLAVLTRHQQATAAAVGLFNDKTPHYMASGGPLTPPSAGVTGLVGQISQTAIDKATSAANQLLGTFAGAMGGGSIGANWSGSWVQVMQQIAAAKHWNLNDWKGVVQIESGGTPGIVNAKSGAFGLGQFLGSTAEEYAKYGALSSDPVKQIEAMAQYIADRYGNPTNALAHEHAFGWYATGGPIQEMKSKVSFPGPVKQTSTGTKVKPGTHAKAVGHGLSPKAMSELSGTAGKVAGIEANLTQQAAIFSSEQARFSANEAMAQYINPDGSLNAAGIALKQADDQTLVGIQQNILNDYLALDPLVTHALSRFLGKDSKVESQVRADVAKETANKAKIKVNQQKVAQIDTEILTLRKPSKNIVQAITNEIAQARSKYATMLTAARAAKARYTGTDTATKAALSAAVTNLGIEEQNAVNPLTAALVQARIAQDHKKTTIASEIYGLDAQKQTLTVQDTTLGARDSTLATAVTGLKGILSGANGATSTNASISALETIAATLGNPLWSGGKFTGIDTTDQGGAYDTRTQIQTLQNDIAQTSAAAATTVDDTTLVNLLEQQATTLAETVAVSQGQLAVLSGFIPNLPKFASGGPILRDGPIFAHAGEHVVPKGGTLVSGGGGAPPVVNTHVHVHGNAQHFIDAIHSEIDTPRAAMAVSRRLGSRTRMLAGAPGGGR